MSVFSAAFLCILPRTNPVNLLERAVPEPVNDECKKTILQKSLQGHSIRLLEEETTDNFLVHYVGKESKSKDSSSRKI